MKSKRKNAGHLNKEIHEQLGGLLFHAKPNEAPWYDSGELAIKLKQVFGYDIDKHKLGIYLTAARFVKKDFFEPKGKIDSDIWAGPGSFNNRRVKKWRVGIYGVDKPEPASDIKELTGLTWDEIRDEDKEMYKVICGTNYGLSPSWENSYQKDCGGYGSIVRNDYLIGADIDDSAQG